MLCYYSHMNKRELLIKSLTEFLALNELKKGTKTALRAEIGFCQGFGAALEGEEKQNHYTLCGIFHIAGRSIL